MVLGQHLLECNDYLAGNDKQRSSDLNSMLRDPEIRAIVFARGGYGMMRLLESIDYKAILADPKILVGMSDVTALQLSLLRKCNLVTFAGPMVAVQVAASLDATSEEWLINAMMDPIENRNLWPEEALAIRILRPGKSSGELMGGCLSLITALLGTKHLPDFNAKILILEDVNEPLYRIDRMLSQLKLSGALGKITGLVLGHFISPEQADLVEQVEEMILQLTLDHPVPMISRFPHGHRLPNLTLPIGVPLQMDTESHKLQVKVALTYYIC